MCLCVSADEVHHSFYILKANCIHRKPFGVAVLARTETILEEARLEVFKPLDRKCMQEKVGYPAYL